MAREKKCSHHVATAECEYELEMESGGKRPIETGKKRAKNSEKRKAKQKESYPAKLGTMCEQSIWPNISPFFAPLIVGCAH